MPKVLVTGCNGYIASALVPALARRGWDLVGLDREGAQGPHLQDFHRADLTDPAAVARAVAGVDTIVHLAAAKHDWGVSEEEYFRDNVEATRVLIEAGTAAGVRDWIHFSTVSVIGLTPHPMDETAEMLPIVPYGATKAEAERLIIALSRTSPECRVAAIRPSVVYGPGNPLNTNMPRLIQALHRGRFLMVGSGREVKTFTYLENLVAATEFVIDRLSPGFECYIHVDEPRMETGELVSRICAHLGRRPPAFHVPLGLATPLTRVFDLLAAITGRDLPVTSARVRKFCRATDFTAARLLAAGFTPPVDRDEALARTVRWYLDHVQGASAREW